MAQSFFSLLVALLLLIAGSLHSPAANAAVASEKALAALIDPTKIATLTSDRAANPRLLKCIYWLHEAETHGRAPEEAIAIAQRVNGSAGQSRAPLLREGLLRNLDIAQKLV